MILIGTYLIQGCGSISKIPGEMTQRTQENLQEYKLAATLWMQNAGEAKALYHQAYNIAKLRLDQDLKENKSQKKRAIIVDADETIIDNSPYQAQNYMKKRGYSEKSWGKWIHKEEAKATPGSLAFLRYAEQKGVTIFYITNRGDAYKKPTFENLRALGFPIQLKNLMLKKKKHSKKERREKVLKGHRVVLLLGDNLIDFSERFDNLSTEKRNFAVEKYSKEFGKKFIMFPNPMYGDWEQALSHYKRNLSIKKRRALRREALDVGN